MGQVRWAGWTMAIVTGLLIVGAEARADITSDHPAAIVVYPKVVVDDSGGVDTLIRLTNVNRTTPINVHCFYLDANSHCSGGSSEGAVCSSASDCPSGFCVPSWNETDFDIILTGGQPVQWSASSGLADSDLPLPTGYCKVNPFYRCGSDADCRPFPGGPSPSATNPTGACTQSNAGTRVPPVPESPFVGELKCIATDSNGNPVGRNELKGEGIIESATALSSESPDFDVASYNAIGIQATGLEGPGGSPTTLTLGGSTCSSGVNEGRPCVVDQDCPSERICEGGDNAGQFCGSDADCPLGQCSGGSFTPGVCVTGGQYNGCPNYLIVNHFFDDAVDPVPGSDDSITTDLTLVPCSVDLLRQVPGVAVAQYLVFNEFEQRFSTSKTVRCFQESRLCNIDTTQCSRSIWNVATAGTLTGQTRVNPIGINTTNPPGIASGLLGVAIEKHSGSTFTRTAGFNLNMSGGRVNPDGSPAVDTITIP